MIQQTKRRPPRPVLTAVAVAAVGYATVIVYGTWTDPDHVAEVISDLIVTPIVVAVLYGLWRGKPFARGLIVLAMAGNLLWGLINYARIGWLRAVDMAAALFIAALLLVPRSSRQWFASPSQDGTPDTGAPDEQPMNTEPSWEETDAR